MDSFAAFAKNIAAPKGQSRVFDWEKAARRIKETGCKVARAGLGSDWEWTGGTIFEYGKPTKKHYTFLASSWAVPELELDGEVEDCFVMCSEKPEWDAKTKWPDSALALL